MEKHKFSSHKIEHIHEEERPLVEFPSLVKLFVLLFLFGLSLSFLFMPWYIAPILFLGFCTTIGIIINPFIGVILFLLTSFVHFLAFAPAEIVRYQPAVITGVIILFTWCFHVMIYRDFSIPKNTQLFYFLVFSLCVAFSAGFHQYDEYFVVLDLVKVLILYFLVIILVKTERQLLIVLFLILFLNIYSATYGIFQQFRGGGIERVAGLEGNPNYFSMNLILLIPLVLGFFQHYRSFLAKSFFAIVFILFLLAVIFSFSRAGALGLITVVLISLWRFFLKKTKFLLILVFLLVVAVSILFVPEDYWLRVQSIANLKDISIRGRIDGLVVGLQMMLNHPFIGAGIGKWPYEYWPIAITMPLVETKFSIAPHNGFIETGASIGIIGVTFFVLLLYSAFREFNKSQKIFIHNDKTLLAITTESLSIGLIGFLVCAMFAAILSLKIFWVILALSVVLSQITLKLKMNEKGNEPN